MATEQNNQSNQLSIIEEDSISALVNLSAANTEEQKINQKGAEISNEIASIRRGQAGDRALVENVTQTANLRAQQGIAKAALAAGVNPMAEADVISKTLGVMQQQGEKFQTAAMNYEANKQGDIISLGPIEWFKKRWESGNNRQEMEHAERQYSIASTRLQGVNNLVQASARTYMMANESLNAASVQALTRIAATDAEIQSRNAELEGLKYNAAGINAARNTTKEQLNVLYSLNNIRKGEQAYQLQLENASQSRALLQEKFEYKKEQDAAKQAGIEEDTFFIQRINVGRGNRGLPPLEGREATAMVKTMKAGGFGAKELQEDYAKGVTTLVTGVPVIGRSPAETSQVLLENKTALPEQRQNIARLLVQTRQQVQQDRMFVGAKPEDLANEINKRVAGQIAQQWQGIAPGSGNLFDVGDMRSYLTLNDTVRNLPVVKNLLTPAAEQGLEMSNPEKVIALVTQGVLDKKITTSQAYDLSTLYQSASLIHNQAQGFEAMGVAVPGLGLRYNTRNMGQITVTDGAQIARMINKLLAARAYEQKVPSADGAAGNANSIFDLRTGRTRPGFGGMSPGAFGSGSSQGN